MVALAARGEVRIFPSAREIRRGGVSYTIDTLREVLAEFPGADLFLVLGADSYDDLPTWRSWREIASLAHWAVLPRPGSRGIDGLRPEDRPRLRQPSEKPPHQGMALFALPMAPDPAASRVIRARLARGEGTEDLVPPAVAGYIRRRGLYSLGENPR